MKTKIILVRHGFSTANERNEYAGNKDYPLSAIGQQQAQLCGRHFEGIHIDALYSSHLSRAYNTALPISKATGIDIVIDTDLRECDGGEWEGVEYNELCRRYPEEYGKWVEDIGHAVCPGGESVEHFAKRIVGAVSRIAQRHEGKTVCIATHATPIRVITATAKGLAISEFKYVAWCNNASINVFEYEDGRFFEVKLNDDDYLGAIRSVLPPNA